MYKVTIINNHTLEMLEQFYDTLDDAMHAMTAIQFADADYCDVTVTDATTGEDIAWY